jgi:hypothetical protein
MLAEIASSSFGFWIVAATIVAVDQAFLLAPGTFAFAVTNANRARLRVSTSPFTLRDRELVSSLLSFPFQLFFVCGADAPARTPRHAQRLLARMHRLTAQNGPLTILSMLAALILVAGPFISASRGIALSSLLLLPLLYLLSIAAGVVLWRMRRRFGLSKSAALKIAAELVLCPVLVINVSKRLSLSQAVRLTPSDVAAFSAAQEKTLAAIDRNLRFHRGE